jgi:hypothetical protein
MFHCSFELNGEPISAVKVGALSFPAFSGLEENINQRMSACIAGEGPIPPGRYYIVDRPSSGRLGPLRDLLNDRTEWFALYAMDSRIDDETYCDQVKRGSFRLHPKGPRGISQGCITIVELAHYQHLRAILMSRKPTAIPRSQFKAYGQVVVK